MGKLLEDLGYAADGKRVMYDGRTGERFDARIFCGAPDYHRLSHMVDDKMFARSVDGPKDPVKRQPVKGRAKGGGIQMGEMEMKTFQSVGSAEVIQELKANCDECDIYVCKTCNSIAYPSSAPNAEASRREIVCPVCKDAGSQQTVLTNVRWAPILVKHVHESAGIRMDMIPAPPSIYREAADAASELPTVAEDETDGEDEETTEDDEEEAEDDEGSDAKKEAE
jgi:transcription elongation factor Elf1